MQLTDHFTHQFMLQLINGAKDAQDSDGQLFDQLKNQVQLTFFMIKLLREFQTQKLKKSSSNLRDSQISQNQSEVKNRDLGEQQNNYSNALEVLNTMQPAQQF